MIKFPCIVVIRDVLLKFSGFQFWSYYFLKVLSYFAKGAKALSSVLFLMLKGTPTQI